MHKSRGASTVAVPSRLAGPAFALSFGVVTGCVGEPFIYGDDALDVAGGDAGLRSAATDGALDDDGLAELGVDPANEPVDVTIAVSDPSRPPGDPSIPVATTGAGSGEAPNPSDSTSAVASTPGAPLPSATPSLPAPSEATPATSATPSAVAPDPSTPPDDTANPNPPSGDPVEDDGPAPCVDCPREECGNGIVESGEECDDGNLEDGDLCTRVCAEARCGDGIVSSGENCEDGNTADGDGCSADCVTEACGDGLVTPNEQCDDGNSFAGDGCGLTCKDEVCGDGIVQSTDEQCDDGNQVDSDLCRNGCTHPASLNSLSSSCAFVDQITQTVCMVATANWCRQFGHDPIAGLVTGTTGDNEYTVGCIVGFERQEVSTSKLDQCPGGRQQSPSCLEQVNAACNELGYDRGFYLGVGAAANTYALACDHGAPTTASVPGCDGIADTSPTPITCSQALSERCGDGKGGIIQARAQWNQATYTCVDLSLTGNVRQF